MNTQMSAEKKPRVCVAIISYNSTATLARCLTSLDAQTYTDFSIVLIDNASDQKPTGFLSGLSAPISYMEMDENLGFAPAMNVALKATESEFLVALNPDAFPKPDWLSELVASADQYQDFAAFGSLQISAADSTVIDGFGDNLLAWGPAWRGQTPPQDSDTADLYECFGVCAAAALYRADTLRQINGFDDRFFCFYEDIDVSFRLRLTGHKCGIVKTAVVDHVGGVSFEGKSDFAQYLMARNQWWVLIKNMPAALLVLILPCFTVMQFYSFIKNPRSARMQGLREGLGRTTEILKSRRDVQSTRTLTVSALSHMLNWSFGDFKDKVSRATRVDRSN